VNVKMQKIFVSFFCCLVSAVFLLLSGCAEGREEKQKGQEAVQVPPPPDYVLSDVVHHHYENGILRLVMTFSSGEYYSSEDVLDVEKCSYVYYDTRGRVLSRGRSQRARLFDSKSRIVAEDEVVVVSEVNGGVLRTEYLVWSGDKDQFTSDAFVNITRRNGDTISGIGLTADLALRYVTIKKNVKGYFREQS